MKLRPALAAATLAAACQRTPPSAPHAAHPATVAHAVKESELTTVTLTPRAVERLGITTAPVAPASGVQVRTFAGDVSVPPGRALTLAAPLAGTVHAPASGLPRPGTAVAQGALLLWLTPFAPADRDVRAQSVRTLEAARARLAASTQRAARTELLARQRAGSERAAEEARAERDTAAAEVRRRGPPRRAAPGSPRLGRPRARHRPSRGRGAPALRRPGPDGRRGREPRRGRRRRCPVGARPRVRR
nr:hypothetical protein [Deltaproteobacteria bacterium]